MSNGRILDHHWVERTKAGQTAWQDSTMPMMERRLLSALRSPMKVSELYRKFADADSQAFLDLMNLLSRRGWVARMDEPATSVDKAVEPALTVSLPPPVALHVPRPVAPVLPEVERPKLPDDLLATLDRYRSGPSSDETPTDSAPVAADVLLDLRWSEPSASRTTTPEVEPVPLVIDRLSSSALTLLDLLNDPVPASDMSEGAARDHKVEVPTVEPTLALEQVGPLTLVDDTPSPPSQETRDHAVPAPASSDVPLWGGMSSLSALQQALQEPIPSPSVVDDRSPPVPTAAPDADAYVFDHDQARASLARSLQEPDTTPPMFEAREAVGDALPLHTLPKSDMIPWARIDERQVRDGAMAEHSNVEGFTYQPEDLVPFQPAVAHDPVKPPALTPARASDLGPKGPDPIEDEDDLMQQLSRPRKLMPSTNTGPVSRPGAARKSHGTSRPRNDAFQQELQRMQAMKADAAQQEQARLDLVARKKAEEDLKRMAEEARRAAIAQNRAEAQRREDAQSLSNLSERMKRIKRNKDST